MNASCFSLQTLTLILTITIFSAITVEAQTTKGTALCVRKSDGVLSVRARCMKNEKRVTLETVSGPAGATGIQGMPGARGEVGATGPQGSVNITACYSISGSADADENGFAVAQVECTNPDTEFLLSDGFARNPVEANTYIVERSYFVGTDEKTPIGAYYVIGRLNDTAYSVTAYGTCCPR